VSVIASSLWTGGVEKLTSTEKALKRALDRLPDKFDDELLDCAPSLGVLTVIALAAAGEVLAPVEASVLAVDGLDRLLEDVRLVRERLNPKLRVAGILACKVDVRTRIAQEIVDPLRKRYPETLKTMIRTSVTMVEAPSHQQPITVYAPTSSGSEDYRKLAQEIIRQEN
jgi:chromosome partitioning protein